MQETILKLLDTNLTPLLFLIVASVLCYLIPEAAREKAIYMVIGAALTRVKKS